MTTFYTNLTLFIPCHIIDHVQVENTLFRVPRCEFEQSTEVFADMFLLPSGPVECSEGQNKEHPIVLEGYTKDEFSCLLRVMFPRYAQSPMLSSSNLTFKLSCHCFS